jgi:hypothetical protein
MGSHDSSGHPVMTLRPCARVACRRMFPVPVRSLRIYCDEDCAQLALREESRYWRDAPFPEQTQEQD